MKKTRRAYLAAALGVGALSASLIPLQAAVADSSPPDPYFNFAVQDPGVIVARGAAADVSLRITCFPEVFTFGINMQVTQRVAGGKIANGYAFVSASICDGFPHVVTTRVVANGNAFKTGVALVSTEAFACTPFIGCNSFLEQAEISLRR